MEGRMNKYLKVLGLSCLLTVTSPVFGIGETDTSMGPLSNGLTAVNGSIDTTSSIDYFRFTIGNSGALIIDVDTPIPGPGNSTELDPLIYLFVDNGSDPLTGSLIGSNDDENFSAGIFDSYLQMSNLSAGNYILAIGGWFLSETDARDGDNNGLYVGSYTINFTYTPDQVAIPEPSTYALLGGMLGIAGYVRNRRKSVV